MICFYLASLVVVVICCMSFREDYVHMFLIVKLAWTDWLTTVFLSFMHVIVFIFPRNIYWLKLFSKIEMAMDCGESIRRKPNLSGNR